MTDALLKQFRDMAYIPWNNLLAVIQEAATSKLDDLLAVAVRFDTEGRKRFTQATPEQVEVFEWIMEALRDLARQYAAAAADGSAPATGAFDHDSLERQCRFICTLKAPAFRGITPPAPTFRWSPVWSKHQRSMAIDIVPSDPRWGWDDIPDWNDGKPTTVRPMR